MARHKYMTILLQTLVLTLLASQMDSAVLSSNKAINSSSTYSDWEPQRALDGDPRRDANECGCCAATIQEPNPWYELDLGKPYSIKRVQVEGRDDFRGHYFKGVSIYMKSVNDGLGSGEETRITEATSNVDYVLPEPKSTRYVSLVQYNMNDNFVICELTVYGECAIGEFGDYCEGICHCDGDPCNAGVCPSGKCIPGYEGKACDKECTDGTYGPGCKESCGNCSGSTNICNKQNGICPNGCAIGYQGDTCKQPCAGGFYGQGCIHECGNCKDGTPCHRVTGHCENGCAAGYKQTSLCETECDSGTYGVGCNETCGNCKDGHGFCAKASGFCSNQCKAGYKGDICKTACDDGSYGENCITNCGNCLNGTACNTKTGVCVGGCSAGNIGDLCVDECPPGLYGSGCSSTCGNCTADAACHRTDGTCIEGCKIGFKKPLCQEKCDDGTYGFDCLEICGRCFGNEPCDKENGTCSVCEKGFTGDYCISELSDEVSEPGSPVAAIGGAVGGVAGISVVVIVIIVITVRRRRMKANASNSESAFSRIEERKDPESIGSSGNKRNVSEKPSSSKSSSKSKDNKTKSKTHASPSTQANKETDMYSGFLTRATDLKICQLWDYITQKKKEDNLLFYQEFNRLTSGLQHPHQVALMKENRPLTRYRALCAYDHSRVPLDTSDGGNCYINASFINGTDTPRKFIASQGPTVAMRNDFWRMIWQYNSSKIVMLTNLIEMGTEKCLIYWPKEESADVTYGNITVSLVSKHVTTDYDIRKLKVRKNSSPARTVTHYHFKAWPDKDVPDSTWPLVKFWRTVMEDSINGTDPIVVHCSAGIGRTGTFIAMDNAYHQAKETGEITMLDLVKTLRDQRVNMVQTKDQYVFLHEAVADALLFGTHIIWSRDFENIYKFLTHMDRGRGMLPMQEQFILITESVEDRKRLEQRNDAAISADIYSNIFSNNAATETSITIDEYMPKSKSMENVREHGAVLLPNYEMKDAFIMCISPKGASFEGFWSIISEQNIKTVIMMTDSTSKHYKKCKELGASDKKVESSFRVKCLEESLTRTCCHKRFSFDSMDGPKDVSQFEFKHWPNGCLVPKDSRSMLDFLEIVLQWQQRLTSTQPILVHCSTGFERSGLVCVLLNELERMNREQGHINILETVKLMKERNEHIIPNYEQYKYVYDTILETFHKDTASEETMPDDNVYENCQQ